MVRRKSKRKSKSRRRYKYGALKRPVRDKKTGRMRYSKKAPRRSRSTKLGYIQNLSSDDVIPPIDIKILKNCDKAQVSEESKIDNDLNIGEFFDVYCVANNKKRLAALDFSRYGIKKFRITWSSTE